LSPALANLLFEAANFLVLAAVLSWVLFKPVRRALDTERERHAAEQQESERLRAEVALLTEQTRRLTQEAERDIELRRQQILNAAEREASELVEEARRSERVQRQALTREFDATRAAEVAELGPLVGSVAAEAVRQLLQAVQGPSIDAALVRAACEKLETLPADARRSAQVESARPLEAEARSVLESALGGAVMERVVPELGCGVRVTTTAGQVDATALSLARHVARCVSDPGTDPPERPIAGASHA